MDSLDGKVAHLRAQSKMFDKELTQGEIIVRVSPGFYVSDIHPLTPVYKLDLAILFYLQRHTCFTTYCLSSYNTKFFRFQTRVSYVLI